jgi:hypothetical protein
MTLATGHWGIRFWHSLCALICYSLWISFTGAGFGLGGWISSYVSEAILNDWGNAISYGVLALIIALSQILAVRFASQIYQILIKLVTNSAYGNSLITDPLTDSLWIETQEFWAQAHHISCRLVSYRGYISWLTMTALGGVIGGRLSILASWNLALTFDDGVDFLLIYGTLRGFMTGLLQWLVFRRHSENPFKKHTLWWVIIAASAGGISFRIGVNLIARLQVWTPTVTGLIYGALTGLGYLIWVYGNVKHCPSTRSNQLT